MQLLSQKKIHAMRQEEGREAIERGMELAARTDALRKLNLSEEKELSERRDSILGEIRRASGEWDQKLREAQEEVRKAQETRKKALLPLEAEWSELRAERDREAGRRAILDEREARCSRRESELDLLMSRADSNSDRTAEILAQAEAVLRRRELQLAEVERMTRDLTRDIGLFSNERDNLRSSLANRERIVAVREKEAQLRKESLDRREREMNLNHATAKPADNRR